MSEEEKKQEAGDEIVFESETDSDNAKDPAEIIGKLKERFKACQKERQEYLDGWQRMKADMANIRKREQEERSEFIKFSKEEVIRELLPAMDSFHIAFGNKEAWEKVDLNWRMGVQYIYSQLIGVLEKHGISLIEPKAGDTFDPKKHASVGTVLVTEKAKEHVIMGVVQKGYSLYGKILEPARVKVGEFKSS